MEVGWLGNSCVEIIDNGIKVLIDPNYIAKPKEPINYVLITHEHSDHIDPTKLSKLEYKVIIAPKTVLKMYDLEGIEAKPGFEIDDIKVLESWCWKSQESVSYYYKGILHAGDSARFPDVKNVQVVFTACFPDFYDEYVTEMLKLKPNLVIPIHYSNEKRNYAEGLVEKLRENKIPSRILNIGEFIKI